MGLIPETGTVLFIGDSITDAGRDRSDHHALGEGYVTRIASRLAVTAPGVQVLNRGIGGNRTADLRARWQQDCLDLSPALVSIMIGINDVWRRYDSDDPTPVEAFEENLRAVVESLAATPARLVLIEPFLLPVRPEMWSWRDDLDPKLAVVRRLALEHADALVALDGPLHAASVTTGPEAWAADGVHPTDVGHDLIARAWEGATS